MDHEIKVILSEKCFEHGWDYCKALADLEKWFEVAEGELCDFCKFDEWYEETLHSGAGEDLK